MTTPLDADLNELKDSLDNINIIEHAFEPSDQCDLTLHFKDHAFHVHSVMLGRNSAYFNAAIQAARSPSDAATLSYRKTFTIRHTCTLTDQCRLAGHSCLTLPGLLGGTDYNTTEMQKFLDLLYDPSAMITSIHVPDYYVMPAEMRFRYQPPKTIGRSDFRVSNNKIEVDQQTWFGELRLNYSKNVSPPAVRPAVVSVKAEGQPILPRFLERYSQTVHLAHYFDCAKCHFVEVFFVVK